MFKLKKETTITDELAMSIRALWHIKSMEEKKNIIKFYNNLCSLFLLIDKHPQSFSPEDLVKYKKKKETLSQSEKDLMSEIFTALHMGIIVEPLDYTVEEVQDFYSKGLYFTKNEIDEIIKWQRYSGNNNHKLVFLLNSYLKSHLYFDSMDDAEKAWEEYETYHQDAKYLFSEYYFSSDFSQSFSSHLAY